MKVYLSGPMAGYPELNIEAFAQFHRELEGLGFDVISPHDIAEPEGLDPEGITADVRALCLRADVEALAGCDGIVLIPGWRDSTGANVELSVARMLNLEVFTMADGGYGPNISTAQANQTLIGQHLADLREGNHAIN